MHNLLMEYYRHFFQASAYMMMIIVSLRIFRFHVSVQDINALFIVGIGGTYINHLIKGDEAGYLPLNVLVILCIFIILIIAMTQISWQYAYVIATTGFAALGLSSIPAYFLIHFFDEQNFTFEPKGDGIAGTFFLISTIVLSIMSIIIKGSNFGFVIKEYCHLSIRTRRGLMTYAVSTTFLLLLMLVSANKHTYGMTNAYELAAKTLLLALLMYVPFVIFWLFYHKFHRK
ncbi:hypothetical protein SAMN02799624_05296 [Paenibacillus sp. UNC496MF]|uniref:hypothetical protein n=1 Tax=Paenibacillus sp. UNC496MF TaxID=1502753 RepID=UPI0008E84725|nr:hypothetical protein [Paenibacillus sp. UNC496MF]SFJ63700.1 hypothetical protein SAMN02799624_05296 [Paenibacillus sp. UNC496MF]